LPEYEEIAPEPKKPVQEFDPALDDPDDEAERQRTLQRARQISFDDRDDM
jgi:type IV secretion system protein VirD4